MTVQEFCDARVSLVDVEEATAHQTGEALRAIGFRKISRVEALDGLIPMLERGRQDLLLFGLSRESGEVMRHVFGLRRDDWPNDPFVPIIFTSSGLAMTEVGQTLRAGPDQILLHPFSPAELGGRVRRLLTKRKEFVETRDYVGPDRRSGGRNANDGLTVPVPNALKAVVEGCSRVAPTAETVSGARQSLQRVKLGNLARRIVTQARAVREAAMAPDTVGAVDGDRLNDLWASAVDFCVAAEQLNFGNLPAYGRAVELAVRDIAEGPRNIDSGSLRMLVKSAISLQVAAERLERRANA